MTGLDGKVAFLTSHFGICIMSFICTHFQLTKTHWCILLWNNWLDKGLHHGICPSF